MAVSVKIEGLRELDAALGELGKATGKNVLKRVGIKALQPMAGVAQANAPVLEGHLQRSIAVGTKLTTRQSRLAKNLDGKASVTVYMGPNDPAAVPQEFGAKGDNPQPFMRPAWDGGKQGLLESLKAMLWTEIDKAAKRKAARLAKAAAKG